VLTVSQFRVTRELGARSVLRGGSSLSRLSTPAAVWASHRRLLLPRFGCDACADGSLPTLGPWGSAEGPETFSDLIVPSRFGGWAWR
jgi:hypothetical protein